MNEIISWLLAGDVSLQYQTRKYLFDQPEQEIEHLRKRIATEGWGKAFLEQRNDDLHWGRGFYQPKWISSHYSLLDLRYLEVEPVTPIVETIHLILDTCKTADGSIYESRSPKPGDVCVNGMFLNYASFFGIPEKPLRSIIDYLLDSVMPDGGFNCEVLTHCAVHSSMHTTISVLEGFSGYIKAGYQYRVEELKRVKKKAEEFLLMHQLYKSDKTGTIIDKKWTMLSFPSRWRYDILRALVYFVDAGVLYDSRMEDAVKILLSKKRKDGTWPIQAKHSGMVHFDMESTGHPSRINTLRVLRVNKALGKYALPAGTSDFW